MNIEIANRLLELRKKNKLSQEELATRIGISRQAISKWERAEASPDTDNLISLAKLYNVSLDELLKTDEDYAEDYYTENISNDQNSNNQYDEKGYTIIEEENKFKITKGMLYAFPYPILVVIIYLSIGFSANLWHPSWILFLTIPIYYCAIPFFDDGKVRITKRTLLAFPYPVLVVGIFLLAGFCLNLWHPAWILFLTIPIYYCVVPFIEI